MDLQDILEKNKHKLLKLAPFKMPAPPSIAMEDRPYSDIDLKVNLKTHKKPIATGKQTGSKQVANSKQIVTRPELNGKQTGNKLVTNGKQTGNKRETNR